MVVLRGGDMGGNFFCILTATDRLTQWMRCNAVWNRGAANTKQALVEAEARFPFPLFAMRSDSGSEFLYAHVIGYARKCETPLDFSRSRSGNKNDNARAEQKNGSVVREYLVHNRLDNYALKKTRPSLRTNPALQQPLPPQQTPHLQNQEARRAMKKNACARDSPRPTPSGC